MHILFPDKWMLAIEPNFGSWNPISTEKKNARTTISYLIAG